MRRSLALAAVLTTLLSSCSSEASPADVEQLSQTLQKSSSPVGILLDHKKADCVARAYLDSGLSNRNIENLKAGKPLAVKTQDDREAMRDATRKIAEDCL